MTSPMTRRRAMAGGVAAAAAALAGCVASGQRTVEEPIDERYETDDVDALSLETRNGDLSVTTEERETIAVEGQIAAASEDGLELAELETARRGGALELAADSDEETPLFGLGTLWREPAPRVDLDVTVPEGIELERVRTRNGEVTLASVEGDVHAETRNGAVNVDHVRGDLEATTRNGVVDVSGVEGDLTLATRNGDVAVSDVGGALEIETRNGRVDATAGDGDVAIETRNGAVSLEVPPSTDAELDLTTRNGTISIDLDELSTTTSESFSGTVGDGERRIAITTRNGDIEL